VSGARESQVAFLRSNPFEHPRTLGLFYREKMRAIHRLAPVGPVCGALEIGGGQSGLTRMLYPQSEVVTIDIDAAFAGHSVYRAERAHFVAADATRLPFPDDAFDVVTMFDVLEHVPDDASAAREAWRVVRPAGALVVSAPNERWRFPYYAPFRRICPTDEAVMAEWGHVRRGYSVAALARLIGRPPDAVHTFINPVTVIGHDLAFSRLSRRAARAACVAVAPLSWAGYAAHRPATAGTEAAVRWDKR
jgi:SAM-dependent methyltransferase